ncbi:hypothetical protein QTP70_003255 [Hemibagrus guttatus]|uniref:Uncharacterized protein n=1 Tax=Hemibagrus guttatus TaxID=175788 RepID=A0AAE0Q764_9TELE|nr:hypothetical protein QTP70_003255 [Hemibagrus guttatus]KAK3540761.1 hypothetical protein QTP86_001603 [Hemibagrus guttatus]
MKKELRSAYQLAAHTVSRDHERNKRYYDVRVRNQALEEGDHVLVRNLGIPGKHKLQDRWNSLPYKIIAKLPNLPVYRAKPERGAGIVKTVHRDHLLPIGYLVRMPSQIGTSTPSKKPTTRAQNTKSDHLHETTHTGYNKEEDLTSESEGEITCYLPQLQLTAHGAVSSQDNVRRDVLPPDGPDPGAGCSANDLSDEEEHVAELPSAVELMEEPSASHRDSVVDTELGQGDVPISSTLTESTHEPTERRKVKPVLCLSYDEPGQPTQRPVTIAYRDMVIQIYEDAEVALHVVQLLMAHFTETTDGLILLADAIHCNHPRKRDQGQPGEKCAPE